MADIFEKENMITKQTKTTKPQLPKNKGDD